MICSYTNKQTQYQLNFIKETNLFLVRIHIWYQFMALTGCPSIFFKADCVHTHIQSTNSLFAKGTRSGSVDSKPVASNYHDWNGYNGIVLFPLVKTCVYSNSVYALNIPISIVYTILNTQYKILFFSFLYSFIVLSIIALCFAFPEFPLTPVTTSSSLELRAVVAVSLTVLSQGSTSSSAGVCRHRGHYKTNNQHDNQQFSLKGNQGRTYIKYFNGCVVFIVL